MYSANSCTDFRWVALQAAFLSRRPALPGAYLLLGLQGRGEPAEAAALPIPYRMVLTRE